MAVLTRDADINEEIIKIDDVFDTFYTKTEVYTRSEVNNIISNYYTKTQINAIIDGLEKMPPLTPPSNRTLINWKDNTYTFTKRAWYEVVVKGAGGGNDGYASGSVGVGGAITQIIMVMAGGVCKRYVGKKGGNGNPPSGGSGGAGGAGGTGYVNGSNGSGGASTNGGSPGGGGGGGASAFIFENMNISIIAGGGGGSSSSARGAGGGGAGGSEYGGAGGGGNGRNNIDATIGGGGGDGSVELYELY
jgi:hypothetical protein